MQKYYDVVQNKLGLVVEGAKVLVTDQNGSVASIYSTTGATPTPQTNPMTTDSLGRFSFYAADGRYNLKVTILGVDYGEVRDILLDDPADSSPTKVTNGIITNSQVNNSEVNDSAITGGTVQGVAMSGSEISDSALTNVTIDGMPPMTVGGDEYNELVEEDQRLADTDAKLAANFREALRRSYAEAGYTLVAGSFEAGGAITAVNQVLLFEADGKGYSWGGSLPKSVPAGSTPASTGGISAGAWIDRSAEISESISVLSEGAVGNSTTGLDGEDSTSAFLAAIAKCKATGKSLYIPKALGGYRLTAPIDVRGVNILESYSTLYIDHAGIGIILGGNANNPNNPSQYFGTVIRATGTASKTTPDLRAIGAKGQHIFVGYCDYFQVYANDTAPSSPTADYSTAYSTFTIKKATVVDIWGENGGWINENLFYLNRTQKIVFEPGPYEHNHNKFFDGTMEGDGAIYCHVGNNNKFYGFRFERVTDPLYIIFGPATWGNSIQASWVSSPRYTNEPYNPSSLVSVTDDGQGNSVYNIQDLESDERVLFDLSPSTPFLSNLNTNLTGNLNQNTDMDGVRFVKSLARGKFRCITANATMYSDGRIFEFRNGDMVDFVSDQTLFRPLVYLFDAAGKALVTEPTDDIVSMTGKTWLNGAYTLGANVKSFAILFKKTSQAKYFRVALNFGNSVAGIDFEYARMTMRLPKDSSLNARKGFDVTPPSRVSVLNYFSAADISMANIGEGVLCFLNTMAEMKVNLMRHRYSVQSIAGSVITVLGSVQYFDLANCFVVYTDSTGANIQVAVSAVSGSTITLSAAVPADIVVGISIDFIVTKTKTLT